MDSAQLVNDLQALPVVRSIEQMDTFQKIYGKRVIIIGGGAQVGQVALGAISEADRHNIRGERISVDTIPAGRRSRPGCCRSRRGTSSESQGAGYGGGSYGWRDFEGSHRSP